MQTSTYTCFTPYLDCLFMYRFVILPSTKGVKVCICDAEEYGLPSMSVKSTPKFENRNVYMCMLWSAFGSNPCLALQTV